MRQDKEKENISRAEQVRRRREDESKRRIDQTKKRSKGTPEMPVVTRTRNANQKPVLSRSSPQQGRRFNAAVSMPVTRTISPTSNITLAPVEMGPRWASALLTIISMGLLFMMWTMPPFTVGGVDLIGAQRISAGEVSAVTGIVGKPGVMAFPQQIEANLRTAFPEFSSVHVAVTLPAQVIVTVTERTPVAAWQYNNQLVWIDANGVAFPARGTAEDIIPVMALGEPPAQPSSTLPAAQTLSAQDTARALISADMVLALQALQPHVPQGAILMYDPGYGLGWTDPRGWQAYFGTSGADVPMKLQVYETIVNNLTQRGIKPTLISVAYPNAPFYRVEP
jgi:hypothetical protein